MDFSAFNTEKLEEYAAKAKADWGDTPEYREFEKKEQNRNLEQYQYLLQEMMNLFAEFGTLKDRPSDSVEVQNQVKQLQDFISEHFYTCSNEILSGLGKMYGSGGEFTENINKAAGDGTAEFVSEAINIYCGK